MNQSFDETLIKKSKFCKSFDETLIQKSKFCQNFDETLIFLCFIYFKNNENRIDFSQFSKYFFVFPCLHCYQFRPDDYAQDPMAHESPKIWKLESSKTCKLESPKISKLESSKIWKLESPKIWRFEFQKDLKTWNPKKKELRVKKSLWICGIYQLSYANTTMRLSKLGEFENWIWFLFWGWQATKNAIIWFMKLKYHKFSLSWNLTIYFRTTFFDKMN